MHRLSETRTVQSMEQFSETLNAHGGFIKAMWCGKRECEDAIKEQTQATSRCIPFDSKAVSETCVYCGKPAGELVYWAKAY
ncbi:proline--tRNA ligase, partial [Paraburkholderia sp. SIMBA_054]